VEPAAAHGAVGGEARPEAAADNPAATCAPLNALVFDAAGPFGPGGRAGLMAVLERCWASVIEVADALIAAPVPAGKIVFIAPRPDAGELAGSARAALENLARSISVEWARHPVTACALWPGAATSAGELSELVCFLLSPAGDYFSGCRFGLGGVGAAEA
jgi:NAD(P)-dependent dehydrogenase (short-subunit alcohol dehydrogenase family)